jgi:hypothetical protein
VEEEEEEEEEEKKKKKIYHNFMGPPSYVRSVVDRNVVMRSIPVLVASCLS